MKTPEIRSLFQNALLLAAASYLLAGCDELTRFTQERYECGNNPNGLVEIDFREFNTSNLHKLNKIIICNHYSKQWAKKSTKCINK